MDNQPSVTPIIAIVGRTNVGKSTLFNRLIGEKKAIMSPIPGTTRDINFGHCHWRELIMTVVDTAGLDLSSNKTVEEDLKHQADLAMAKADLVVFVVDAEGGLTLPDRALAKYLQRSKKPVLLVANKADNPGKRRLAEIPEWRALGFGTPLPISAANGAGVGDFLDEVTERMREKGLIGRELPEIDARVAIIGRPNVGKSSLLNALAGEERVIVSEVPHTTKEPQDTLITYEDPKRGKKNILLVDTVGMRKRGNVAPGIEKLGVHMSMREMERADVCFLVIDAESGIELQEKKLAGMIEERFPGALVIVNKWDLAAEKNLGTAEDYKKYVAMQIPFYWWAPVTFISAKSGAKVGRLLGYALDIAEQRARRIEQEQLDAFAEKLKKIHHSAFYKGEKRPHVYGLTQVATKPPEFMVVVKDKETLHPNFLRFVENRVRDEFGFEGTPIKVLAREIGD